MVTNELDRVKLELEEALDLSSELSFRLLTAQEPASPAAAAAPPTPLPAQQQQAPAEPSSTGVPTPVTTSLFAEAAVSIMPAPVVQYANSSSQLGLDNLFRQGHLAFYVQWS